MKKAKGLIWAASGIGLIVILVVVVFMVGHYTQIRKDFERLEKESYDTVFFSMYPTDNYAEEDYMHFRGMQVVRCDYEIPNGKLIKQYMSKVISTENVITTVYLGIDPEKVAFKDVQELAQAYPEIAFEIVYAYPQVTYWLDKSDKACEKALQKYLVFAENLLGVPNVRLYLFSGEEWLICNKGNYESEFSVNAAVSQFLMCNSDLLHPYMLKPETVGIEMANMRELIERYRTNPMEYPDARGYDIVFLGDSIMGNYTDSMSVPEVVGTLTNANVYNCGYGGTSAASGENNACPVSMIVEALASGDVSRLPEGELVYKGVKSFLNRENPGNSVMFVINYGLNDYFNGFQVSTEDAFDISSYSGALRAAIKCLQENYPEALILLNTPNFTIYYECGEEIRSDVGGKLTDYVEAVIQVGEEMGVEVLDNYNEIPITEENWTTYLSDGCHLNEYGRFLLGSRIALKIQ